MNERYVHISQALGQLTEMSRSGVVLEKLLEYLSYKCLYETAGGKEDIPDFQERIQPEIALELYVARYVISSYSLTFCVPFLSLMAADYYDCTLLSVPSIIVQTDLYTS